MLEPTAESQSDNPPASRLVIRVKLISEEVPQPPAPPRLSKGALLLIVGAVALLLAWLGISVFRSDPTPPTALNSAAESSAPIAARTEDAPVVGAPPPAVASPTETVPGSSQPEVRPQPDAPLSAINEVVPDVPQSALNTIHGTIRVSVNVLIDKHGKVIEATPEDRGPSRYFERLSLEAAKKWTFTAASSEERRTMLLKFNFTRTGATARADAAQ